MSKQLTIILAAGGTGGHVYPSLATAEALSKLGHHAILATDGRGNIYDGQINKVLVSASSLRGGPIAKIKGVILIIRGVIQALALLRREKADLVLGFGGFPSLPTIIAAKLLGCPIILHEQNAVLGKANRIAAKFSRYIATAFATVRFADPSRSVFIGNPVRSTIAAIGKLGYSAPSTNGPIRILIFGGSQGAKILSKLIPTAVTLLPNEIRQRISIMQQCRPDDIAQVEATYVNSSINAEVASFFNDMPERLASAHIVIARSGASTVAELTASGRPSLLIPYAAATDDHQTANAEALVANGAAWLIAEHEASTEQLSQTLKTLIQCPEKLAAAAAAARAAARTEASTDLAHLVEFTAGIQCISSLQRVTGERAL
jgi:UDP-N-acetylglucosamine--N-acetylmuramyl-(pentapeptide) pyrophosphoryl-undecaprenol N-acetylglucosamine transferase